MPGIMELQVPVSLARGQNQGKRLLEWLQGCRALVLEQLFALQAKECDLFWAIRSG